MPDFLHDLKIKAGAFAKRPPQDFAQVVTEYRPGAGIGWHRDKPAFGEVVAMSFVAPCTLRFRRSVPEGWDRQTVTIEPRSAYILTGAALEIWEHSILPQKTLRYSVTFRTLAAT